MIVEDNYLNEWDIYDAEQFREKFNIKEKRDDDECDEEFITRHLESDKRKFRVTFMESSRGKCYEEFWRIQEVE